jgi:hypothetical protein
VTDLSDLIRPKHSTGMRTQRALRCTDMCSGQRSGVSQICLVGGDGKICRASNTGLKPQDVNKNDQVVQRAERTHEGEKRAVYEECGGGDVRGRSHGEQFRPSRPI